MDTSIYSALVQQMLSSPASAMVVVGLSIVAYVFEIWPSFNNRVIAPLTILLGPCVYWLFAAKGSVPAAYPYPGAVLVVNGLVAGYFPVGLSGSQAAALFAANTKLNGALGRAGLAP